MRLGVRCRFYLGICRVKLDKVKVRRRHNKRYVNGIGSQDRVESILLYKVLVRTTALSNYRLDSERSLPACIVHRVPSLPSELNRGRISRVIPQLPSYRADRNIWTGPLRKLNLAEIRNNKRLRF